MGHVKGAISADVLNLERSHKFARTVHRRWHENFRDDFEKIAPVSKTL
jgi:hypothetical protein